MFIPRAIIVDNSCPPDQPSCTPAMAITGTDPLEKENQAGPPKYPRPGAHRFIGVAIAVTLVVVAILLWAFFAKWPRQKLDKCCGRRKAIKVTREIRDIKPSAGSMSALGEGKNISDKHHSDLELQHLPGSEPRRPEPAARRTFRRTPTVNPGRAHRLRNSPVTESR
ncbi:hypothetical protein BD779DRAFT_1464798 [Infundibulicybe gibba]|nr:hypothetical protein BD779DRAFT_1464798 [Infundibulicybe gibba]